MAMIIGITLTSAAFVVSLVPMIDRLFSKKWPAQTLVYYVYSTFLLGLGLIFIGVS